MAKAEQALGSSQLLLDAGDFDGACNRAYYAMFDAARAALLAQGGAPGKSHRGVLTAFHGSLVKSGRVSMELGRQLKHAETLRYLADYETAPLAAADAQTAVSEAQALVAVLRELLANS